MPVRDEGRFGETAEHSRLPYRPFKGPLWYKPFSPGGAQPPPLASPRPVPNLHLKFLSPSAGQCNSLSHLLASALDLLILTLSPWAAYPSFSHHTSIPKRNFGVCCCCISLFVASCCSQLHFSAYSSCLLPNSPLFPLCKCQICACHPQPSVLPCPGPGLFSELSAAFL